MNNTTQLLLVHVKIQTKVGLQIVVPSLFFSEYIDMFVRFEISTLQEIHFEILILQDPRVAQCFEAPATAVSMI